MRGPTKYYLFTLLSLSVIAFFSLLASPIHQLRPLQGFEAVFISDGNTKLKVVSDEAVIYIKHLPISLQQEP